MTDRKSGAFRVKSERRKDETTDFPRPDAEQAVQGAPAHEEAKGQEVEARGSAREQAPEHTTKQNDHAHGYTQDSGYQSSGGYAAAPNEAVAATKMHTKKPGNGHAHSDEQIRSQIQSRLSKERAPRAKHLLVSIGEGVVTLRGEVADEIERKRLTDIVRGVGSVRELHDELSTRVTRDDVN